MLESLTSTELTEWLAFERASGPIGNGYTAEMLASIVEQIQQLAILTAQDKEAKVQHVPRPYELYEEEDPKKREES